MRVASAPDTHGRRLSVRQRYLRRFWHELCRHGSMPQLDRWLARRLRAERGLGKRDRQWYADLFPIMRALTDIHIKADILYWDEAQFENLVEFLHVHQGHTLIILDEYGQAYSTKDRSRASIASCCEAGKR